MPSKKKTSKKTPAKRKSVTPANESKADKFKRLGNMRAMKAINAIRNLARLSNRNSYEFTDEQVTKLVDALKSEVNELYKRFTATKAKKEEVQIL